jgi:HEXXH motif-containing protein
LILIGDGVHDSKRAKQLAVSVVHELAHQELFLMNLLDRLVNQPFDYNEIHAPFQGTKRPPIGRLHSYVGACTVWFSFKKYKTGETDQKYQELLTDKISEAFEDQELTPFGKKLVEIAGKRAS